MNKTGIVIPKIKDLFKGASFGWIGSTSKNQNLSSPGSKQQENDSERHYFNAVWRDLSFETL